MASETFVSAMMLITAVVASAILITAVFPIVWNMVSTFSSASHDTDTRMRTDFKIVTTYAKLGTWPDPVILPGPGFGPRGDIYLKNIGSVPISFSEIESGDVFFGESGEFTRLAFKSTPTTNEQWTYEGYKGVADSYDQNINRKWDTGETLHIITYPKGNLAFGHLAYFQYVLPNGVWRSQEFTIS